MREIKFRVRHARTKEIVGYEYLLDGLWRFKDATSERYGICGFMVIREQFTGLRDKNGKEIYEEDRVTRKISVRTGTRVCRGRTSRDDYTYDITEDRDGVGVIVYRDGKWIVEYDAVEKYPSHFMVTSRKTEAREIRQVEEQYVRDLADFKYWETIEVIGNINEAARIEEKKI